MPTNSCPLQRQQLLTIINVILGFIVLQLTLDGHYKSCTIDNILKSRKQGMQDDAVFCDQTGPGAMLSSSGSDGCILQGVVELEETSIAFTTIFLLLSTFLLILAFYKDLSKDNSTKKTVAVYNLFGGVFVIMAASFIIFGAVWIGKQSNTETGKKLCPEASYGVISNNNDGSSGNGSNGSIRQFWLVEKFCEKGFAGFFGVINGMIYIANGILILKSITKKRNAEETLEESTTGDCPPATGTTTQVTISPQSYSAPSTSNNNGHSR